MKLVDEDRATLNQLIWQMHNPKSPSPLHSPASHNTEKMPLMSPQNSSDGFLNQQSNDQLKTLEGHAIPMVAFAQFGAEKKKDKENKHYLESEIQSPQKLETETSNKLPTNESMINMQESCDVPIRETTDIGTDLKSDQQLIKDENELDVKTQQTVETFNLLEPQQKSPLFVFSGRNSGTFSRQSPSDLLKSIEKASPGEIKRLIRETIQCQQERQWNESDLKISGKNMGYPDYLKNLTFAQH